MRIKINEVKSVVQNRESLRGKDENLLAAFTGLEKTCDIVNSKTLLICS